MSGLLRPRRHRSRKFRASAIVIGVLTAALLVAACGDAVYDSGQEALTSIRSDAAAAHASLQVAQDAAQACDPDGAAAAAAAVSELVAGIQDAASSAIGRAQGVTVSDALVELVADLNAVVAETAPLPAQADTAAALAQQRLDDGECDSAVDDTGTGSRTGGDDSGGGGTIEVPVLVIGGAAFPVEQFHEANPDACTEYHYHGATVFALDGTSISDPDPMGCGYGTTSELEVELVTVEQATFDAYRDLLAGGD